MINIAVCGKFHLLNYLPFLHDKSIINYIYMSHKHSTISSLGAISENIRNYPLKEYLTQLHGRVLGDKGYDASLILYHKIWEYQVIKSWVPSEKLHVVAQGASNGIIQNAIRSGTDKILVEVVNTHPLNRLEILQQECEMWKIRHVRKKLFVREELLLDEVSRATNLLAPTKFVAETYRKRGFQGEIHVIPYAANIEKFNSLIFQNEKKTKSEKIKIISVGQIGLRKGQLYLLKLLDFLGDKIELTLVGKIDSNVMSIVSKYEGRFIHYDRVASNKMPELLSHYDLFVSASLEEGLAVSICEAMAMGLAVIATRESGAEELINNMVNGILFDAGNFDQLKEKVEFLIEQEDKILELGCNARFDTQRVLNWKEYSDNLCKIYKLGLFKNLSANNYV